MIKKALKILAGLSLILIALGSYVRATGAGLSCPDWPLCFGRVLPELSYGVAQEMIHRYLAGAVLLLTLFITVKAWASRKTESGLLKFSVAVLLLVVVQAIFGGLTVTMKLNPFIVTTHLALGTVFFQSVCTYAFAGEKSYNAQSKAKNPRFRTLVLATAVLTFLQILVGGFVGASGASLACPGFPSCGIPYASGAQVIQIVHRMIGFSLAAFFFATCLAASRLTGIERLIAYKPMVRTVGLIFLQIFVGWLNLYFLISPTITVIHILLAQGILIHLLLVWRRLGLVTDQKVNVIGTEQGMTKNIKNLA